MTTLATGGRASSRAGNGGAIWSRGKHNAHTEIPLEDEDDDEYEDEGADALGPNGGER